ncbi:MAG: hypothetical protein ABSF61_03265 [Anaerolineales bacterium]|jgi:predicted ferric reductase
MNPDPNQTEMTQLEEGLSAQSALLLVVAVLAGAMLALLLAPLFAPSLSTSLVGAQPKGFWYLSRASGVIAFVLLWASTAFGILISNKMARTWPGGPRAFELHEHSSLLAVGLSLFHGAILLGDRFIHASLGQILLPFGVSQYRPIWVGLGQISFYLLVIVTASFYVRKRIGHRVWRGLHYASFVIFLMALLHGFSSGTDASTPLVRDIYWLSGGIVLFLTLYRILAPAHKPKKALRTPAPSAGVGQKPRRKALPVPVPVPEIRPVPRR